LDNSATLAEIWNYENTALRFGTNNTEAMRITNGQNVGIGTSSPSTKLHLHGATPTVFRVTNDTSGTSSNIAELGSDSSYSGYFRVRRDGSNEWFVYADPSLNVLNFTSGSLGGSQRVAMAFSGAGILGVATQAPSYAIGLGGDSARQIGMERRSGTTGNGHSLTINAGAGASTGTDRNGGNLILQPGLTTGSGTSSILFQTYSVGSSGTSDNTASTTMTAVSGNVGIGTTTPIDRLHLSYPAANTIQMPLRFQNLDTTTTGGSTTGMAFKVDSSVNTSSYKTAIVAERTSSHARQSLHVLQNNTADTSSVTMANAVFTIDRSGNVGINNTFPAYKLTTNATGVTRGQHDQLNLRSASASIVSGNMIGGISMNSADTDFTPGLGRPVAGIYGLANEDHTATAMGTDLAFFTTNATAVASAEVVRFKGGGNVGIGTSAPNLKLDINGDLALRATNNTSTGTVTALTTTGTSAIRLTSSTTITLQGIGNGVNGKILRITNLTNNGLLVVNESGSATAANRIITGTGADITIPNNNTFALVYDSTTQRWRVVAGATSSGAGGSATARAWAGYFGSDCGGWSLTSTTYTDFSADTSCTLTELHNTNMTVTKSGGSNTLPGITFTPVSGVTYGMCFSFAPQFSAANRAVAARIQDTTNGVLVNDTEMYLATTNNNAD
jgi:hypothetical protein